MALSRGARLGVYEVLSPIGAGGMGEVYRARDTSLNRDVALKVLPEAFVLDADRLARFKREAQVLASLNHPHIGAIYGLETANGSHALVLELVEGPTLAERLNEGPIALEDAVQIARQIAEALEAAHEQGVVHRDLKPGNVKLRPDGTVKVLDFGLAKALDAAPAAGRDVSQSPTMTSPALTQLGMILGTAAYMSPEQAKGRPVDKRSDVWAFGALLYEMLSGKRAFDGEDVSEALAAVLRQDVNWSALPASTPPSVRQLIARCLERDVKRRLRDIGEARIVLSEPSPQHGSQLSSDNAAAPRRYSSWRLWVTAGVSALIAAALVAGVMWGSRSAPQPRPPVRLTFDLPDEQAFVGALSLPVVALSPDGSQLVYAANQRLFIRSLSQWDIRQIQGTEFYEAIANPVFSPDGRSVAFFALTDRTIKAVDVAGGATITLGSVDPPFGMTWASDGILVGQGNKGIVRISPNRGAPVPIVRVEADEEAHGPQLLPGGSHVLFTLARGNSMDRWESAAIVTQSLRTGERVTLIEGGSDARYISTGHLVYASNGVLFAAPFDPATLRVGQSRVPMIEGVRWSGGRYSGAHHFSVADNGSLAYLIGDQPTARLPGLLSLIDRHGAIERLKLPDARSDTHVRASPDGRRIAYTIDDGKKAAIYTHHLSSAGSVQPLVSAGNNRAPVWAPDNQALAFQSDQEGDPAIWVSRPGHPPERLTTPAPGESHEPESWTSANDTLLFSITKGSDITLWTLSLADKRVERFSDVLSRFPTNARFSPDGRWIAYTSRGRADLGKVYVEPFPATGEKHELFIAGVAPAPHKVVWSPKGDELFYIPRFREFEVVSVTTKPAFSFGRTMPVPRPFTTGSPNARTSFDIMPDGRFVSITLPGNTLLAQLPTQIHVVLNWFEELKARVPTGR